VDQVSCQTVLCYGDSNTFGYNPERRGTRYAREDRWTTILAERLGADFEVLVEGLNGRTSAYDRPGAPWKNGLSYLRPCLVSHFPLDIVVFMLGTNDCNIEQHLSAGAIADGMRRLLEETRVTLKAEQGTSARLVLVAPPPIRPEFAGTPYEGDIDATSVEMSLALPGLYAQVAREFGACFVDASSCEVSPLDCEHLTRLGHRRLAGLVAEAILASND